MRLSRFDLGLVVQRIRASHFGWSSRPPRNFLQPLYLHRHDVKSLIFGFTKSWFWQNSFLEPTEFLIFFFVQYVEGVSQFILRNLHKLRYNCLPSLAHTRDYNLYFGQNMYFWSSVLQCFNFNPKCFNLKCVLNNISSAFWLQKIQMRLFKAIYPTVWEGFYLLFEVGYSRGLLGDFVHFLTW